MTTVTHSFDDALAYERFMGRWSLLLSQEFLRWLSAPSNMTWLDVGCGTGIFTKAILETCSPATVVGVDYAQAQIEHARRSSIGERVNFRIADARQLPLSDASFDVVASMLAINFVPDRSRALKEMRRVTRANGIVGGCVWDFAAELSPSWPLRLGMSHVGVEAPPVFGTEDSSLAALTSLFRDAGFKEVEAKSIEVAASFDDFDELWHAQTPSYAPLTKAIAQLPEDVRTNVKEFVRARLPTLTDGRVTYRARANAVRARVPFA